MGSGTTIAAPATTMRRFTVGSITDKERRTGKISRRKRGAP
jgi:hypothetical protein